MEIYGVQLMMHLLVNYLDTAFSQKEV
jgi:hypothetical protein